MHYYLVRTDGPEPFIVAELVDMPLDHDGKPTVLEPPEALNIAGQEILGHDVVEARYPAALGAWRAQDRSAYFDQSMRIYLWEGGIDGPDETFMLQNAARMAKRFAGEQEHPMGPALVRFHESLEEIEPLLDAEKKAMANAGLEGVWRHPEHQPPPPESGQE